MASAPLTPLRFPAGAERRTTTSPRHLAARGVSTTNSWCQYVIKWGFPVIKRGGFPKGIVGSVVQKALIIN
eukprot:scaffold315324_cov37-Tisochrysis_lutea.AAC.3